MMNVLRRNISKNKKLETLKEEVYFSRGEILREKYCYGTLLIFLFILYLFNHTKYL